MTAVHTQTQTHTHRSYTESDGERREVGRKQTEGHMKVVDEAILHATVWCALHERTAVCSADVHHTVTLQTHIHTKRQISFQQFHDISVESINRFTLEIEKNIHFCHH